MFTNRKVKLRLKMCVGFAGILTFNYLKDLVGAEVYVECHTFGQINLVITMVAKFFQYCNQSRYQDIGV